MASRLVFSPYSMLSSRGPLIIPHLLRRAREPVEKPGPVKPPVPSKPKNPPKEKPAEPPAPEERKPTPPPDNGPPEKGEGSGGWYTGC